MAIVPGSASGQYLVNEVWNRKVERNVYDILDFANVISDKERLYNLLHMPKVSRFTYNTLTSTAAGNALTASDNTETAATLSPSGIYIMIEMSANQLAQSFLDLEATFQNAVEEALAEGIETIALSNNSSITTYRVGATGANIDGPTWRSAIGKIPKGARSEGQPGKADIHLFLPTGQYSYALGIPEFTHAQIRGDGEDPTVKGMIIKGSGAELHLSNVLPVSAATSKYGCVFVPKAFGISWNERISVDHQVYQKATRIIGYANFGSGIVWDPRAVRLEFDDPS